MRLLYLCGGFIILYLVSSMFTEIFKYAAIALSLSLGGKYALNFYNNENKTITDIDVKEVIDMNTIQKDVIDTVQYIKFKRAKEFIPIM